MRAVQRHRRRDRGRTTGWRRSSARALLRYQISGYVELADLAVLTLAAATILTPPIAVAIVRRRDRMGYQRRLSD